MANRTMIRIKRMAATAMPIPMPALAPVDKVLLASFDMGEAFAGVVSSSARIDVARLSIEDMLSVEDARVLRPAKHETR